MVGSRRGRVIHSLASYPKILTWLWHGHGPPASVGARPRNVLPDVEFPVSVSAPTAVRSYQHPLIVTTDSQLLDDLLRLAAAGSAEVRVAPDVVAARPKWASAPFVLLGVDAAAGCVRADLAARTAVILVAPDAGAEPPWHVAETLKAERVAVLPAAEAWLVDRLADHAIGRPTRGSVVAVLGGRGGAGASVLATALAVTARRIGLDTLLVDADPFGGGVDLVLGWERMQGLRWPDLVDARGRVNPPALVDALPGEGSLAVLSFDRTELDSVPTEAMAAALDAGRRGRDLVVVDLPRRFDEPSRLALTVADRAYVIVPAELRACAAARRVATVASAHCPTLGVVVRGPGPVGMDPAEIARAVDLPLAGTLRPEPGLVQALETGHPPAGGGRGPLADLCRRLLADMTPRRHRAVTR
jgi:secretion/DNA translocation related CpaE-like protein